MFDNEAWDKAIKISNSIRNETHKIDLQCAVVIERLLSRVWLEYDEHDSMINNILKFQKAGGRIERIEDPLIIRCAGDICYEVTFEGIRSREIFNVFDVM